MEPVSDDILHLRVCLMTLSVYSKGFGWSHSHLRPPDATPFNYSAIVKVFGDVCVCLCTNLMCIRVSLCVHVGWNRKYTFTNQSA